jgi:hypothetical protein
MQLFRHMTANHIGLKELPFLRELSMEAYLVENPDVLALDEDELSEAIVVEAELPIAGARTSRQSDGRIDLVAVYGDTTVAIIELKLGELNDGHFHQLSDYLRALSKDSARLKGFTEAAEPLLLGVLVGSSISTDLRARIEQGLVVDESIPIAALTIRRYKGSDNNVYVVTDTFFRNLSRNFDRTKYLFDGETLGKGRLVLAVIRKWASDNPKATFAELLAAFPRSLRGGKGCFRPLDEALKVFEDSGRRRHFIEPPEVIDVADARIAVSSQWGIRTIPAFIENATKLGFKIVSDSQSPPK